MPRIIERSDVETSGAPAPGAVTLDVVAVRVAIAMLLVVWGLTLFSLAGQISKYYWGHDQLLGFTHKFNVSHEGNIPTWYSSLSLLCCAVLLGIIGLQKRRDLDRFSRHWNLLACLFLYLSIDEGTALHEMMNTPLRNALGTAGLLYYPAALVGALFALLVGFAYLTFLRNLPARTGVQFVAAALVYLGGALGVESLSARQSEIFGKENMTYAAMTTVEEFCEMLGVVLFVYALLAYMARHVPPVLVRPRVNGPAA